MASPKLALKPSPTQVARPRTCLQVLPALVTGGVERGTVDMALAQVAAGWRALVVSSGGVADPTVISSGERRQNQTRGKPPGIHCDINAGRKNRVHETRRVPHPQQPGAHEPPIAIRKIPRRLDWADQL